MEYSCLILKFGIDTLIENIKLVVTEDHEFECRKESKLLENFCTIVLSGFWWKQDNVKLSP